MSYLHADNAIRKETKEEIYLILAEFYKFPTEEFYLELANNLIADRLEELFKLIGFSYADTKFLKGEFLSLNEMKVSYINCFLGINQNSAIPIESVYKVWTTDPGIEIAIGTEKGYLFGDSALHMLHLYEKFQLSIPDEYVNIPDHLTLLLEFLAFLIREDHEKEVLQLLVDHFDWLDDFNLELKRIEHSSFFVKVTELLIALVNFERNRLETGLYIS